MSKNEKNVYEYLMTYFILGGGQKKRLTRKFHSTFCQKINI